MFIRSEESAQPGIVVDEGATFTLNAQRSREYPNLVANLRPRSTAALLVAAGRPPAKPLRLSDTSAFEQVHKVDGLVNLHARDEEDRVAGYSVAYLSRIFAALDPDSRTPPPTVQLRARTRRDSAHGCGCKGEVAQSVAAMTVYGAQNVLATDLRTVIVAPVPSFVVDINVHVLAPYLSDIIVKKNATLVLDDDVTHLIARNVYCYEGSRILQKSRHLNVDITGTLRGGIPSYVHFFTTTDVLKIRVDELQRFAPDKP